MAVTYRETTLDNGLRIVAEIDDDAHTAAAGFFVKTGARDEAASYMGVSHYLEHMMFKGTERRNADDVNREFDEIGANYNAYTASEMTAFYAHVLPEYLERGVDLLADIMRPTLRVEDFETERGVILEEIAMYKDQPFSVAYEEVMEKYYGDHPMSYRVLGTDETIKALTRDQMKAYFEDRYSADNTVVALAGQIDFEAMTEKIRTMCGHWQRTGADRTNGEAPRHPGMHVKIDPKLNRTYAIGLAPAPAAQDPRRYAAAMLSRVLGESEGSRLYWALVETGLAEAAEVAYESHDGMGDFLFFTVTTPERTEQAWRTIDEESSRLIDSLEEDDLTRLRNRMLTSVTVQGERPAGRMQRLGRRMTYFDDYRSLEEELEQINAVTLDDLRAVYEAYPLKPQTIMKLAPRATDEE
jgi:predicted Zn-dependent peptidase